MSKLSVGVFKGGVPRLAPAKLPNEAAQAAVNCRLLDGNIGAWKNFLPTQTLCKTPPVNTIYLMDDTYWLQWTDSELAAGAIDVDVARSTTDSNGRVFFTGLDVPRWTDSALVASGSGCYPQATRVLGVINPTEIPTGVPQIAVAPGIDITDTGDQFDSWSRSGLVDTATTVRSVTNPNWGGNNDARYYFQAKNSPQNPYMEREFGVQNSAVCSIQADIYIAAKNSYNGYAVGISLGKSLPDGPGPAMGVAYDGYSSHIEIGYHTNNTTNAILARTAMGQLSVGVWYKLKFTLTRLPDGSCDCLAQILDNSGVEIARVTARSRMAGGAGALAISNVSDSTLMEVNFDNIIVQASGAFDDTNDDYTTSYVYTWVNSDGEESGPSPASDLVVKDDGTTVLVTTPTSVGTGYDYDVVSKRIYRALTVLGSTSYYFLAEQLLWYQQYEDNVSNATLALNEVLATTGYELPPTDLRGIMVLPNDIYAGFSGRQLCLSERGQPHAWPIANRYAIDTDIVAIGAIDAQVVILGTSWPWLAAGNEPSVFSMNNTEVPQGCVSKRSVAYLKGVGVVYASPDGLVGVAGTGQVSLLTSGLYTRKEWQELNPSSLIGAAHDNRYFGFYETPTTSETVPWSEVGVSGLFTFETNANDSVTGATGTLVYQAARSQLYSKWGSYSLAIPSYTSYEHVTTTAGGGLFPTPGNTEDFTMGGWVYLTTNSNIDQSLFGYNDPDFSNGPSAALWRFNYFFNKLGFTYRHGNTPANTFVQIENTSSIPQGAWFHIEVNRSGNTLYFFINGTLKTTSAITDGVIHFDTGGERFVMGSMPNSGDPGATYYLDEIMVLTGTALHTTSFTPPTAAYSDVVVTPGTKGGFMLEAGADGFGVVELGFHASAVFTDTSDDTLYLVLDQNQVPEVGSGSAGLQPAGDGTTIFAFDQYEGGSPTYTAQLPFRWRSKKYLQPWNNTYRRACVRAEDYTDLWFMLYTNGTLAHTERVTSAEAFVLPDTPADAYLEFEIIGTSSVESVELAHDVEELEG